MKRLGAATATTLLLVTLTTLASAPAAYAAADKAADKLLTLADGLVLPNGGVELAPVDVRAYSEVSILGFASGAPVGSSVSVEIYFLSSPVTALSVSPKVRAGDCTVDVNGVTIHCSTRGSNIGNAFKVLGPYMAIRIIGTGLI